MGVAQNVETNIPTAEVARRAGVHKDTLLRWLRSGLVPEPRRDRRGWRVFSSAEAKAVERLAKSCTGELPPSATRAAAQLEKLSGIDWDFVDAKTNYLTHGIHPYPAKFIPQIPNALIQELSSVGDTVGDIFSGSGTTLVEALTLKRRAVGVDANPLACLIARSKTGCLGEAGAEELRALALRSRETGESIAASRDEDLFPSVKFISTHWRPDLDRVGFWFENHVIEELAEVLAGCRSVCDETARNLALTAFSSIVVAVSKQDSDTRYVRREKNIPQGETMRRFSKSLEQATRAALEFADVVEPRFTCDVIEADLLTRPVIPKLDLMVCSPPYPNAYSYHLYHMTRMLWLGMDQPRFKREEIGSHRKYSSNGKNAATAETFRREFSAILDWLAVHTRKGGYACFVVGDSTLKGVRLNNADLISEAGVDAGFVEVMRFERTMQATKKAFNPAIGRIKTEKVLVLENTGGAA
jgi:DNA modification methylase